MRINIALRFARENRLISLSIACRAGNENDATTIAAGIASETVHHVACTHVQHTSSRDQGREKGKKKKKRKGERKSERKGGIQSGSRACFFFFFFAPRTTDRPFFVAPNSREPTLTDSPYSALCNIFLRGPF